MFRVELPGPEDQQGASTEDARVTVAIPRAEFNRLADRGRLQRLPRGLRGGPHQGRGRLRHPEADRPGGRAPRAARPDQEGPLGAGGRGARFDPTRAGAGCAPPRSCSTGRASAKDPAEIARAIAGAQAQDVYAGPLTFRSRSRRLTAADITRARTEERSLLRTWVMRMTIHLIPTDDAGWMLPLFEPGIERWSGGG